MTRHDLRELLFPQDERDADFRKEIERFSVTGLRVASILGIGGPLLMALVGVAAVPRMLTVVPFDRMVLALLLGFVPLAISYVPAARPHLRLVGIVAGLLISIESIYGVMRTVPDPVEAALLGNAKATVVLLVGVAAFPLKPVHALAMGLGTFAALAAALATATHSPGDPGGADIPVAALFIVATQHGLTTLAPPATVRS